MNPTEPGSPIAPPTPTKSPTAEISLSAAERGKTDLYFLAKIILGRVYPDLTERTHKPICDFFVQKDPRRKFYLQDLIKNRLLLRRELVVTKLRQANDKPALPRVESVAHLEFRQPIADELSPLYVLRSWQELQKRATVSAFELCIML